jgi:calcium binding protein 39
MPCGTILREALKFDVVAAIILCDESREGEPAIRLRDLLLNTQQSGNGIFWEFFEWIDRGSFEVSADAFTTFRVQPNMICESCTAELIRRYYRKYSRGIKV